MDVSQLVINLPATMRNIKKEMELRGYNDRRLCLEIGVNPSSFGGWRRGENSPSLIVIIRMAALFECDVEDLVVVKEGKL